MNGWLGITKKARRVMKPCDVFINHRSVDTKKTVSTLLYENLKRVGLNPFLDDKAMKAGDKLLDEINGAILECKVGVAVFSPRYCESRFCLHELALLMESRKKLIPIFCDVKPSQLLLSDDGNLPLPAEELRRYWWALEQARDIVGLNFNSSQGSLSDIVTSASEIISSSMKSS